MDGSSFVDDLAYLFFFYVMGYSDDDAGIGDFVGFCWNFACYDIVMLVCEIINVVLKIGRLY